MYRSELFVETPMHVVHDVICWLCWQVVLKSQILAGGRGLGKFKNGLQGGVHIVNVDKVQELGEQMLNQVLVTKQTGRRRQASQHIIPSSEDAAHKRNVLCNLA